MRDMKKTARDPLEILFGNQARVKLLRFFLFNPRQEFTCEDISRRARLVRRTARTELNALERAGVIKRKKVTLQTGGKLKRKVPGFVLDETFPEIQAWQTFLFETAPIHGATLLKHVRRAGKLDFVACAGVFIREFDQRLDVLLAMKKLNEHKVETAIRSLEAELGIEIRYAAMSSEELAYRVGMYDKLTRDVFDYPHTILVDKIGIRNELAQKGN